MPKAVIYCKRKGVSFDIKSIKSKDTKDALNKCISLITAGKQRQADALFTKQLRLSWNWRNARGNPFDICDDPHHFDVKITSRNCDCNVFLHDEDLMYSVSVIINLNVKSSIDRDDLQEWISNTYSYDCIRIDGGWKIIDYVDEHFYVEKVLTATRKKKV